MSQALSDQQKHFLQTYLGVAPSSQSKDSGPGAGHTATLSLWNTAKEKADNQLVRLSDHLRKTGNPDVQSVADEVETLLEPLRVELVSALMQYDSSPRQQEKKAAIEAIESAKNWLGADDRVQAVDNNPWKIQVNIERTIGDALNFLERNISTKDSGDK